MSILDLIGQGFLQIMTPTGIFLMFRTCIHSENRLK